MKEKNINKRNTKCMEKNFLNVYMEWSRQKIVKREDKREIKRKKAK